MLWVQGNTIKHILHFCERKKDRYIVINVHCDINLSIVGGNASWKAAILKTEEEKKKSN